MSSTTSDCTRMISDFRSFLEARAFGLARIFIFAITGAILVAILVLNEGKFTYSLDDTYIHLSVSEQIWRGSYGVNVGEYASPSSSVLFPFILALGAWSPPIHEYMPLAFGLVSLLATVEIMRIFVVRIGIAGTPVGSAVAAGFIALAALSLNLVCIVFTGMEHSGHVALTAAAILGLVVFLEERNTPWWFLTSVALLPLVRYEGLGLSLPILLCLGCHGRWRTALALGTFVIGVLAAFSGFLVLHGLPFLPSSVLSKSPEMARITDGTARDTLLAIVEATRLNLSSAPGFVVGLFSVAGIAVLWADAQRRTIRRETWVAFTLTVFAAGQLVVGNFGWWGRYEVYALVGGTMMTAYLARRQIVEQLASDTARSRLIAGGLALQLLIGASYARFLALTPLSANNVYEQQYMMHRFIVEKLKGPVAVNDLGWASYQNDNYVFDMVGLGSEEARRARPVNDLTALDPLIRAHGIKLAILYRGWYLTNMPPQWKCVGALHLSRRRGSPAQSTMEFCATASDYADEMRQLLKEFRADLPARIRLEIYPPGRS